MSVEASLNEELIVVVVGTNKGSTARDHRGRAASPLLKTAIWWYMQHMQ